MPEDLTDGKSTLVQAMAWCRQATSHCWPSQCWPRTMSPYISLYHNELMIFWLCYAFCWSVGTLLMTTTDIPALAQTITLDECCIASILPEFWQLQRLARDHQDQFQFCLLLPQLGQPPHQWAHPVREGLDTNNISDTNRIHIRNLKSNQSL